MSSIPSISLRNWFLTRTSPPTSSPRTPMSESISSMKTIAGCPFSETSLAFVNSWETFLSDSPSHFDIREAASAQKNIPLISLAIAAASSVFPQPGGPKNKIPRGQPSGKRSGRRTGKIIDSSIARFGRSSPAMSSQLMSGFSVRTHWSKLVGLDGSRPSRGWSGSAAWVWSSWILLR